MGWEADTGRCQSGQMEQTVNLPAYAFGGSNPSLPNWDLCYSDRVEGELIWKDGVKWF